VVPDLVSGFQHPISKDLPQLESTLLSEEDWVHFVEEIDELTFKHQASERDGQGKKINFKIKPLPSEWQNNRLLRDCTVSLSKLWATLQPTYEKVPLARLEPEYWPKSRR